MERAGGRGGSENARCPYCETPPWEPRRIKPCGLGFSRYYPKLCTVKAIYYLEEEGDLII